MVERLLHNNSSLQDRGLNPAIHQDFFRDNLICATSNSRKMLTIILQPRRMERRGLLQTLSLSESERSPNKLVLLYEKGSATLQKTQLTQPQTTLSKDPHTGESPTSSLGQDMKRPL